MKTKTLFAAVSAILIASASAQFHLDFGTPTSNVQSGYTRVTTNGGQNDGTALVGDNISISIPAGQFLHYRDRGQTASFTDLTNLELLRDIVYVDGLGASDVLTFTISGLTANAEYEVFGYAVDMFSPTTNDNKTVTWTTSGGAVNHTTDSGNEDLSSARFKMPTMTADGTGEATITAQTSGGIILWNGFDIVVPQPDPVLTATDPADDTSNVPTSQNLVATFDEDIVLGASGTVTIKDLTAATDTVISLPGPDANGTLSVSGAELTIAPATPLTAGHLYSIEISAGTVEDLSGNPFGGLADSDDPNWSFTTDGTAPAIIGMTPMADATDVTVGSNLSLSFDEDVLAGTGDITLHLASDNSVVASIDVNSGLVSIAGGQVTIDPPGDLAFSTAYYVNISAGAITDLSANSFAGISDTTTWRFTTAAFDPTLLFADNFNRPDATDLNASASGKSGSLGALDWIEVKSGGEPTVTGNTLRLGESGGAGGGWSMAYLDHNFIDSSITAGGEFTVSIDLVSAISGGGTRFAGFAVGHSLAEVNGWSTNLPTSFTSDFFIGYDPTGTTEVKIFRAGQETFQQTVNLSAGATLSVRFSGISNFNSGSTVNYEAFIDGSPVTSGSFFWSGTDENHIALYSNYTNMQGIVDNFEVRTAAGTPTDPFTTWAASGSLPGTVTFEGDLNGDGVQDGIAFLLGVANPDDDANDALPTVSDDGNGGLVLTFDCLATDDRGEAQLKVAHSATLAGWTPTTEVVPDADGTDAGGVVSYVVDTVSVAPLHRVTATIDSSAASAGKLFGRLEGTE